METMFAAMMEGFPWPLKQWGIERGKIAVQNLDSESF